MPTISAESVEYAIQFPAPGQVDSLLDFEWLVPHVDGGWWGDGSDPLFPTYYLFTTPERMEPLREENQRGKEFEEKPYPLTTPATLSIGDRALRTRADPGPRDFRTYCRHGRLSPDPDQQRLRHLRRAAPTGSWLREVRAEFARFLAEFRP